jgi:hypothetical protein
VPTDTPYDVDEVIRRLTERYTPVLSKDRLKQLLTKANETRTDPAFQDKLSAKDDLQYMLNCVNEMHTDILLNYMGIPPEKIDKALDERTML